MISNHAIPLVNYINLIAKWFISRNFQQTKPLIWDEFVRYAKFALNSDKCVVLEQALKSCFIPLSPPTLKSLKSDSNIIFSQYLIFYVKCGGVLANNCSKRKEKEQMYKIK